MDNPTQLTTSFEELQKIFGLKTLIDIMREQINALRTNPSTISGNWKPQPYTAGYYNNTICWTYTNNTTYDWNASYRNIPKGRNG